MTSLLRLLTSAPVRLRQHAELTPVLPDDQLVTASIGPHGEAIALWSTALSSSTSRPALTSTAPRSAVTSKAVSRDWASVAVSARPVGARVTIHWPDPIAAVNIADLDLAHPIVQPLPGERTLVVARRCPWHPDGVAPNARIFDAAGDLVTEAILGDGIAHVLATAVGDVWVGYTDEGVFGNYGWGGPGPEPVGSSGIVRFSAALTPTWRFPATAPGGPISDCYALNVAGESVWSSYYPDFPLVRIGGDAVQAWPNHIGAVRAIIVDGGLCALIGGYAEARDRIVVGSVWEEYLPQRESVLVLPDGEALPPQARLIARGHALNVFVGTRWYKVDVELFPGWLS